MHDESELERKDTITGMSTLMEPSRKDTSSDRDFNSSLMGKRKPRRGISTMQTSNKIDRIGIRQIPRRLPSSGLKITFKNRIAGGIGVPTFMEKEEGSIKN